MAVDEKAERAGASEGAKPSSGGGAKAKRAGDGGPIAGRVGAVRRRLRRGAGRDLLRKGLPRLALAAGALGAARPWLWPLPETAALVEGPLRTLAVMAGAAAAGAVTLLIVGRRRGPSALGAARSLDAALDRPEVVASGYAFEREGRDDGPGQLARERALEALAGARPEALFALPPALPPWRKTLGAIGAIALGLALGSYHPALRGALLTPPRPDELEAAGLLRAVAEGLAKQGAGEAKPKVEPGKDPDPAAGEARLRKAAELARQAAQAAQRCDRSAAIGKLASMR
ncbi:MAG TPA: hypothetical protein VFS00_02390, partial [Polyangiaceae bacterium]|nr:hypothetical protein [Polyangiaceae bacterium]